MLSILVYNNMWYLSNFFNVLWHIKQVLHSYENTRSCESSPTVTTTSKLLDLHKWVKNKVLIYFNEFYIFINFNLFFSLSFLTILAKNITFKKIDSPKWTQNIHLHFLIIPNYNWRINAGRWEEPDGWFYLCIVCFSPFLWFLF